jgi:hypothetical protein
MIQLNKKIKFGFTIVELMLSMTFISALLLAIATMTMRMTSMYVKGNTMKDLNSASRTINDDFTHTFNSMTTTPTWSTSDNAQKSGASYISNENYGAFCTGEYSYLWNTAKSLNATNDNTTIRFNDKTSAKDKSLRLVKVKDSLKSFCSGGASLSEVPIDDTTTNLLPNTETGLMVYGIRFYSNDSDLYDASTSQRVVNISYILGTKDDSGNGIINSSSMTCDPTKSQSVQDYCAINKFELTVRTIGRK